MFKQSLLTIFMVSTIFACKPVQSSSSLQWGLLSDAAGGGKLISVGPNEKVEICGNAPSATAWAVLTWANAIGRADGLSRNMVPCGSGGTRKVQVDLQNFGSDYAPAWTAATNVTINTGKMSATDNAFYRAVLLHEIGHAWGLCDQYGAIDKNTNCAVLNSKVDSSVMGTTNESKQALTQDDIAGLTDLAGRVGSTGWPTAVAGGGNFQIPTLPYGQTGNMGVNMGMNPGAYPTQMTPMGAVPFGASATYYDPMAQMMAYLASYMVLNPGR